MQPAMDAAVAEVIPALASVSTSPGYGGGGFPRPGINRGLSGYRPVGLGDAHNPLTWAQKNPRPSSSRREFPLSAPDNNYPHREAYTAIDTKRNQRGQISPQGGTTLLHLYGRGHIDRLRPESARSKPKASRRRLFHISQSVRTCIWGPDRGSFFVPIPVAWRTPTGGRFERE